MVEVVKYTDWGVPTRTCVIAYAARVALVSFWRWF